MIVSPKAIRLLAGTCASTAVVLAGCGKGPDKAGSPPRAQAPAALTATASDEQRALAAQAPAPPIPDSSRTDPQAVAMRKKYVEWTVAQAKAANDAAVKQANQALGLDKPAPKGNYGRMTDGLPQQPAGKN